MPLCPVSGITARVRRLRRWRRVALFEWARHRVSRTAAVNQREQRA